MLLRRWMRSACALGCVWVLALAIPGPAWAQSPKDAIPTSAGVVVKFKAPQTSAGKLGKLIDAVQPGFGAIVQSYLPMTGDLIGNSGLRGIDLDQDFFVVVFSEPDVSPTAVFVMTAKDIDTAKKSVSSDYEVHTAGNVIAYSTDKDSLDEIVERLSNKGESLWSSIDSNSLKIFEGGDISVLVNVKRLVADHKETLNGASEQFDELIDRILDNTPEESREQLEGSFDMYRKLVKWGLAAIPDVNSFALGMKFSPDAIQYEDRLQLTADSTTAKYLASQPKVKLSLIDKLPPDKAGYIGTQFDMSSMLEMSSQMLKSMLGHLPQEKQAKLDVVLKQLTELKHGENALYIDVTDTVPMLRTGSIGRVAPMDRMREITRSMQELMGDIDLPTLKQTSKVERNVDKIGQAEIDRITIKQEFTGATDPTGLMRTVQSLLLGDEGMRQLVMYDTNQVLQTLGGDLSDLKKLHESAQSSGGSNAAIAQARRGLPEQSNLVALFDLSRIAVNGLKVAGQQSGLPIKTNTLDQLKLTPSFIAISLSCEPAALHGKLELPVTQFQNLAKIVNEVRPQ